MSKRVFLPPCSSAVVPCHLAVSRCELHGQIEIWIDDAAYALSYRQAGDIGRALLAAAGQPIPPTLPQANERR